MKRASTSRRRGHSRVTGKCHRCGWTDGVTRVDRHERLLLGVDRHVRQLCDDCRNEIIAATAADPHPAGADPGARPAGGGSYRSVA